MGAQQITLPDGKVETVVFSGSVPTAVEIRSLISGLKKEGVSLNAEQRSGLMALSKEKPPATPQSASLERLDTLGGNQPVAPDLSMPNDSRFVPNSVEDLRGGALMAGALSGGSLGATAGAVGGPVGSVIGGISGGLLGLGAASLGTDAVAEVARRSGFAGDPSRGRGIIRDEPTPEPFTPNVPNALQPAARAIEEMALDLLMPHLTRVLGTGVKKLGQKFAGVASDASQRIIRSAQELNIPIGIETATSSSFIRGTRRILGKFPLLGPGFKESDRRIGGALRESLDQMYHEITPTMTTATQTGADLAGAQARKQRGMRGHFTKRYEGLLNRATNAGAVVPTGNTVQASKDLVTVVRVNTPTKIVNGKEVPIDKLSDTTLVDWANDNLSNLKDTLTPRQYQNLSIELNGIIDRFRDNEAVKAQAIGLKLALKKDLNAATHGFGDQFKAADADFSTWASLLESPVGKKFGAASVGIFDAGIPSKGRKNVDTLFKSVFDGTSPSAMKELRELVGRPAFRRALRQHLDGGFRAAEQPAMDAQGNAGLFLNLNKVRSELGLGDRRSPKYTALVAALEVAETGVSVNDLDNFFRVAGAQFSLGTINVSDFVARRAQMSGMKSVLRAMIPGASMVTSGGAGGGIVSGVAGGGFVATSGSVVAGAAAVFATRAGSRALTNPRWLKAATRSLDNRISERARREAIVRFARISLEELNRPQPVETDNTNNENLNLDSLGGPPPQRGTQ